MKNLRHVMVDIETMGTNPDAAIVSIGAVLFNPLIGKISNKTFYVELEWVPQGRCIDPETIKWWRTQPRVAQQALCGLDDLQEVLGAFTQWLPKDCKVWGNGPTFDISILEHAYRQHKIDIPWKYWNVRDCRTVLDMYESKRGGLNRKVSGTKHNALDDAIHQAQTISYIWTQLLNDK